MIVRDEGGVITVMLFGCVAVAATESVTFSVNEQVPGEPLGVPVILPTLPTVVRIAQEHRVPALMLQV